MEKGSFLNFYLWCVDQMQQYKEGKQTGEYSITPEEASTFGFTLSVPTPLKLPSANTYKTFRQVYHYFNDYCTGLGKENLTFGELDLPLLKGFHTYLKQKCKLAVTTTNKIIQRLRKITGEAARLYNIKDPFAGYRPEPHKIVIDYLSDEEIEQLKAFPFHPQLQKVCDIFLIMLSTGISYKKLGEEKELMSIQKFNTYLKYLGELCGIGKKFTSQLAIDTYIIKQIKQGASFKTIADNVGRKENYLIKRYTSSHTHPKKKERTNVTPSAKREKRGAED